MSDAFVQSGVGEVPLQVVLRASDKAFWSQSESALQADLHESKYPGVIVRRPWESAEQHAERVRNRANPQRDAASLGMDPDRARQELSRRQRVLEGLMPEHPNYDKLFDATLAEIRLLEQAGGVKATPYTKGVVPKRTDDLVSAAATAKLSTYMAINSPANRRIAIAKETDLELLALIRDNERDEKLRSLAVQRIEQAKAL